MSNLLIDQLTNEYGNNDMSKIAHELEALDQSRSLVVIGEDLYKIACELGSEELAALATDTYNVGLEMGACLSKTASEDGALEESIEMADDMHKLACTFAEIGDQTGDDLLCKMAETVIAISNDMQENVNEFMKIAEDMYDPYEYNRAWTHPHEGKGKAAAIEGPARASEKTEAKKTVWGRVKAGAKFGYGKDAWSAKDIRGIINGTKGDPKRIRETLKQLFASKSGLKALSRSGIAYGSAAAALYGGKKLYDRYSR
jgi:hypothetical protein